MPSSRRSANSCQEHLAGRVRRRAARCAVRRRAEPRRRETAQAPHEERGRRAGDGGGADGARTSEGGCAAGRALGRRALRSKRARERKSGEECRRRERKRKKRRREHGSDGDLRERARGRSSCWRKEKMMKNNIGRRGWRVRRGPLGRLGDDRVGIGEQARRPLPAAPGRPLLPAAIRQLRTKRSRPMRLIGEPENSWRNPASSSASSSARRGAASSARGRNARWRAASRRTCSTGTPPGNRRSRRCGCRSPRGIRAGSGPCARSSGTRCSAAHRAGRARGRRRSGRRPGRRCTSRSGPRAARRARTSAWCRSRRGTARCRARG